MSTTRPFPGFDRLYSLKIRDWKAFRVVVKYGASDGWEALRGEIRPQDVRARWAMGKRVPDAVIHATDAATVLLSDELVKALRAAHCSGWLAYEVALEGKHGLAVGTYFGLTITGRCGPLRFGVQGEILKKFPGGDVPYLVGVAFDEAAWDGSDVFMAVDRGFIFVTERARDVILSLARSVAFEPLTEVDIPARYVREE